MAEIKRLFIGELFDEITELDLNKRFSHFGKVIDVEIHVKKDEAGKPIKTFAYVEIETDDKRLQSCMTLMNKTKWRSKVMSIEIAKKCFYRKLLQEIAERQVQKDEAKAMEVAKSESMKPENVKQLDIKSAVPGTKVPGKRKWVISKFGRALPIVYIRRKDKKKIMMVDPSKFCHNIKHFKEDTNPKKAKRDNMVRR